MDNITASLIHGIETYGETIDEDYTGFAYIDEDRLVDYHVRSITPFSVYVLNGYLTQNVCLDDNKIVPKYSRIAVHRYAGDVASYRLLFMFADRDKTLDKARIPMLNLMICHIISHKFNIIWILLCMTLSFLLLV